MARSPELPTRGSGRKSSRSTSSTGRRRRSRRWRRYCEFGELIEHVSELKPATVARWRKVYPDRAAEYRSFAPAFVPGRDRDRDRIRLHELIAAGREATLAGDRGARRTGRATSFDLGDPGRAPASQVEGLEFLARSPTLRAGVDSGLHRRPQERGAAPHHPGRRFPTQVHSRDVVPSADGTAQVRDGTETQDAGQCGPGWNAGRAGPDTRGLGLPGRSDLAVPRSRRALAHGPADRRVTNPSTGSRPRPRQPASRASPSRALPLLGYPWRVLGPGRDDDSAPAPAYIAKDAEALPSCRRDQPGQLGQWDLVPARRAGCITGRITGRRRSLTSPLPRVIPRPGSLPCRGGRARTRFGISPRPANSGRGAARSGRRRSRWGS